MSAWRMGLFGRILLALAAVGLLPLGIATFQLVGLHGDAMTEQVLRTHAVAATTTAERIEAFLAARRFAAEAAAANPALSSDPRGSAGTAALSALLRSSLGIAAVSVRADDGVEVVRAQLPGRSVEAEVVLRAMIPGEAAPAVAWPGGQPWLGLAAPLAGAEGTLVLICDLAPLAEHLRPRELGEQADLVLVDVEGSLVLGGEEALTRFPARMLEAALSGKLGGAGRYAEQGGEPVLGAFSPVEGASWTVLSRQPASVAEAIAETARRRAWMAVGLALGLTAAAGFVAHRTLLEPIRDLVQAQRRLAGAEEAAPAAGGEIAQLKASFALLEKRLQEKEELGRVFLGRYQVVEVVGEGAMGTVFRAWDPTLKRPVALKTVRFDADLAPERAEHAGRLLQEAVAVARFSHPNIVGIYDVQESPEVAFLSMEYVDGESLEGYAARNGPLAAAEVAVIGAGIARGLAAAHEHGTLHRDVKPANVLLGRDGEVKIADFGISEMMSSLTAEPDMVFGTPGFIPPEVFRGKGYEPAGDLFALGVTLYRLVTGKLPFAGRTVSEVVSRTMSGRVAPPAEVVPGIPEELSELILELLDREAAGRPAAAEVLRRLSALYPDADQGWTPRPPRPQVPPQPTTPLPRSQHVTIAAVERRGGTVCADSASPRDPDATLRPVTV